MSSPFEAAGFRCEVHQKPQPHEFGESLKTIIPVVFLLAIAICVCIYVKSKETYQDIYDLKKSQERADYEIAEGAYVYFAPITTEGALVGVLPEGVVIYGAYTYTADYISTFDEPTTYIGFDAAYLKDYGELDFSNEKDDIIWVRRNTIYEISPEEP